MKTKNVLRVGQLANTLADLTYAQTVVPPEQMQVNSIQKILPDLVAELRSIFIAETGENPWAMPIEAISQQHLDELSQTFIGEDSQFPDFYTFWPNFLASEPEPTQMSKLLEQVKDWGYVMDDDSETVLD
ncbi:hypothetical protein GO755_26365 [Spirosoma sp. HMF4905]|uniref:Uncharacterized protein n=1 Tax=Spirosoma arboris TaxID=2682092 RepID=A0A7K1SIF3_9BACT|nr:hypothetical protein [Spirosoma arboris]MVM33590.1 hypothetical protein [Spirosoma arboris]